MDLLESLLRHEGPRARAELVRLLNDAGPPLREMSFNIVDVTVDLDSGEVRVWDILDSGRDPQVLDIRTFRERLA